ncbi:MAG: hypothetical protein IPP71_01430 [Bacteroidetes bacterium]|nr:hypothetical protein [Bacteroidota bacterium]
MKIYNIQKYIAVVLLVLVNAVTTYAGGPATKEVSVEGIKVIFKQTPKDVISVRVL